MNRKDIDWKVIKGALISVVLSLVASASLVWGSFYFKDAMQTEYNRHDAEFKSISRRYLAIDEEEKLIKKYYPEFLQLYNKGVIGQEQRLNWIEILKNTGEEIGLPSLVYTINTQRQFVPAFNINMGRFQLYASEMKLNLSLLHEGDLVRLFEGIRNNANGVFSVDECSFSVNGDIVTDDYNAPNIQVSCLINWYTIKLSDGTEIKV